jgi:MerR family transcriptional regulator/heat shock protein HspR
MDDRGRYMISVAAELVGMHPQTLRIYEQKGLNLAGVEMVLQLEDQLRRMQRRLQRMEREMNERLRQVEREYKRELVLWEDPKLPVRRAR